MDESVIWENKSLNDNLRDALGRGDIPEEYWPQMEQGLMLSGAARCLFTASDGIKGNMLYAWYTKNLDLRKRLIEGWQQFEEDYEAFEYVPPDPVLVGNTPDQLPTLRIQVTGSVTRSNVTEFRAYAVKVFDGISTDLNSDQDFADAELAVKFCKDVEKNIGLAKDAALAQTVSIDDLFRALDDIKNTSRAKRLSLEKLVKHKKESIKIELVNDSSRLFWDHITKIQERLGGEYMPHIDPPFGQSISGLKSIDSMKDKLNTALANAKIEANEVADRIQINLKLVKDGGHDHLVPDIMSICDKNADDFKGLIALRLQTHQAKIAEEEKEKAGAAEPETIETNTENQSDETMVETPPAEVVQSPPDSIRLTLKTLELDLSQYCNRNELAARTAATFKKHFLKFIDEYPRF